MPFPVIVAYFFTRPHCSNLRPQFIRKNTGDCWIPPKFQSDSLMLQGLQFEAFISDSKSRNEYPIP